jgi:uncharacterized protein (DUF2147 family)
LWKFCGTGTVFAAAGVAAAVVAAGVGVADLADGVGGTWVKAGGVEVEIDDIGNSLRWAVVVCNLSPTD